MKNKLHILIIEDSEDDALLDIIQIKKGGYNINYERVETSEALISALNSKNWDIILSDYQMPNLNGLEALSIVKECEKDIPFIIISGLIGEDVAVEAMKAGAHDYIMKDNLRRLLPAVEREIRESKNRGKQKRLVHKEKLMQEERLAHFKFFESMDKINRAIQGANELEQMMSEVLDVVLSIFDSDRAYLLYPCDPEAKTWLVPKEKNKPEYPGVLEQGLEMPVDEDVALSFRILLDEEGPVMFGPGTKYPLPGNISKQFKLKNYMAMAIYPKIGKPWQFGIHQCSKEKVWTKEEKRLFHEIGRRLTDGLTSLLVYRERCIGEAENRAIVNAVPDLLFRVDKNGIILDYRKPEKMELYLPPEQFLGKALMDVLPQNVTRLAEKAIKKALRTREVITFEYDLVMNDQQNYFEGRAIKFSPDEVLIVVRDITGKKLAEMDLQKTNNLLSAIIQAAPTAIIDLDLEGKVKSVWNPTAEKMFGWKAEEAIGNYLPSVPVDKKEEFQTFRRMIKEGKTLNGIEVQRQRRDGTPIDYSIYASPLYDKDGQISGNVAVLADITERKKAEEELRKFSLAVEQSPVSIVITNISGEIKYVNSKFTQITGYSREEAIGKNPRILKSGELPDEYYKELWQTITSGKEWFGEFHNLKKNGELYWEMASISPIFDSDGNITHFLAIKEDITERKLTEKALLDSERKYRIVADNTYNWEFWANTDGNYIYCSPSCFRVTGYTAKEFIDNPKLKSEIIHPDHKLEFTNHLQNVHKNMEDVGIQFKIIHKNGTERWIEHISRPVFDSDGTYLGQRGSNRDITEKKETDRKILDAIITTEENERNSFSQDLHDGLGPMLSTIKLYFQWLGETTEVKKRKNIIKIGLQNIDDAIQTVREISNKLSPRVLNNLGLMPAMKYLINRLNETQKIKISFTYDVERRYDSLVEVTLYRIFSELINNTLKYANARTITMIIQHNEENKRLFITYKDDGKGFNLKKVLKNKKGMGMQNMKQRVETLNGIINFDTGTNKSLTVKIELPLSE